MPPRKQQGKGFDVAEFLGTDTSKIRISFWLWGIAGAAFALLYGVKCTLTQSGMFVRLRPFRLTEYNGAAAVAIGVAYIAAAVYLHCWCCWSEHEKYYGYAELGRQVSAIVCAGGILYLVFDMMFMH